MDYTFLISIDAAKIDSYIDAASLDFDITPYDNNYVTTTNWYL